jgi:hypothetical protein
MAAPRRTPPPAHDGQRPDAAQRSSEPPAAQPSDAGPPEPEAEPLPAADPDAGRGLVLVDAIGTGVFAVTAVVEASLLVRWAELVGVTVALVLFAAGCLGFLLAYARAVQRSRHDEIAVASLFLLAGPAVPGPVKAKLGSLLAVQVVVALATAITRSFSPLAFGVLVPVFGVGVNGLWAARYGAFPPRRARPKRSDHRRGGEMGQNADHG